MRYMVLKKSEFARMEMKTKSLRTSGPADSEVVVKSNNVNNNVKKFKRIRSAFTTEQINYLEREFRKFPYIGSANRKEVACMLKITERAVKIWFQNRRMKEKKEKTSKDPLSEETVRPGFSKVFHGVQYGYACPLKSVNNPNKYNNSNIQDKSCPVASSNADASVLNLCNKPYINFKNINDFGHVPLNEKTGCSNDRGSEIPVEVNVKNKTSCTFDNNFIKKEYVEPKNHIPNKTLSELMKPKSASILKNNKLLVDKPPMVIRYSNGYGVPHVDLNITNPLQDQVSHYYIGDQNLQRQKNPLVVPNYPMLYTSGSNSVWDSGSPVPNLSGLGPHIVIPNNNGVFNQNIVGGTCICNCRQVHCHNQPDMATLAQPQIIYAIPFESNFHVN